MVVMTAPDPALLNKLLSDCGESIYSTERLSLALERSLWTLSVVSREDRAIAGFVRATSDQALNANLWNLTARPGPDRDQLIRVIVYRSLELLRRDVPGCSISVSAAPYCLEALRDQGFMIDPSGIRVMGLSLAS